MSINLISNPSFENGISPWTLVATDQNVNTAALVSAGAYSGNQCVYLASTNAGQAYIVQNVLLTGGHNYSLSFYAKRTGSIDVWTGFAVDNQFSPLPSLINKVGASYAKVTQEFTLPGTGSKVVSVYIFTGSAAGSAWIDNVELVDISETDGGNEGEDEGTGDNGGSNTPVTITGTGYNKVMTLKKIHAGLGYFKKDTATTHSQVRLMQQALTSLGYNTQGSDGKFGTNTQSAVKAFQRAEGLSVDGLFGRDSLLALENAIGGHLDPDNCGSTPQLDPLTVDQFIENLEAFCNCGWTYGENYDENSLEIDCAYFPYRARLKQGAHGCTSEYNNYLSEKGVITSYDDLQRGMEIFQAENGSSTKSHMGVYAGKVVIAGRLQHAVYQSCSSHNNVDAKYNNGVSGDSGPNLTGMNDKWKYWGWSRYVEHN